MSDHTIVWALDVLGEGAQARRLEAGALKMWTRGLDAAIHPVHVVSRSRALAGSAFGLPPDESLLTSASERMAACLKSVKLPGMQPPKALLSASYSSLSSVQALLDRAKQVGAELIVAGTYQRKGLSRLLIGSFAEGLVQHSAIPLLINGLGAKPGSGAIYFATDFSFENRQALSRLIPVAQRLKSKVVLVHHVPPTLACVLEPLTQTTLYRQKVGEDTKERKSRLADFSALVTQQGVKCESLLVKGDSTALAIAAAAKRGKARFIAVGSTKGPVAAALAGSTARQLIRSAASPVWVMPRGAASNS